MAGNNDIFIRLKALLEAPTEANIKKAEQEIKQKLGVINLKTNIDTKNLDKVTQTTKQIEGDFQGVTEKTKEWTKALGVTVQETQKFKAGQKEAYEIIEKTTISQKEMNKIHSQALAMNEKITFQTHKQSLAQKDLLTQIKSMRGKDSAFISDDNLIKLDRLERGIKKLDPAHKNFTGGLNSAKSQLKDVNADIGIYKKEVQDASKFTNVWGQSLFDAGKKFAGWMLVATLIMTPVRALREGLSTLKEIDTELINIAKVTEYTKDEMKELAQTAVQVGHEFGRTAQEYLQATTEFARAGFGQQAEEYAKLSLLLQNVGDVTATVANETLLAANAGFQLGGSYELLLGVIDKFNNISNKNATTVTKMSDAMKVGASVFHSAGMSIDETVAIIGTATASTQRAGSEISRAWRTILMNIRQVASEQDEVTEESMKKAESALNSIGIVVRDTPSTFRPMFEIIRDLGKAWEGLSQVEQAYVSEALAGKRQSNVLIATLQNWDMAEKQLIESINASGSAMEENAIYMDSWEAKAKQLSSAMTQFWNNLLNTDVIKTLITSLTQITNILDILINNSFSSFLMQVGLLTSALTLLGMGFNTLKSSTLGVTVGVVALDIAEKGLIVTTKTLTATLLASPLFWTVVASAGIIAIAKAIDKLSVSFKEQQEIVANLNSEVISLQTEYSQLLSNENRTPEQEKYLKLLEQELEVKKELLKIEAEKAMKQEFFTPVIGFDGLAIDGLDGFSKAKNQVEELIELQNKLNNAETKSEADKINEKTLKLRQALIDTQKTVLDNINKGAKKTPEVQKLLDLLDGVINKTDQSTEVKAENNKETKIQLSTLEDLQSKTEKYASSMELLNKAQSELTEENALSSKTLSELIEKYPEIIEQTGLQKDKLLELISAKKTEGASFIEEEKRKTDVLIEQSKRRIKAYEVELKTLHKMEYQTFYDQIKEHVSVKDFMGRDISKIITEANLNKELAELDKLKNIRSYLDYVPSDKDRGEKKLSPPTPYQSRLEEYINTLQLIREKEQEITEVQKQRNLADEQDRIPLIQKEIELQNKLIDLNSDLVNQQKQTRQSLANQLGVFSDVVKVSDDLQTLSVNTDQYNKLSDKQKENLDNLISSFTNLNKSINSSKNAIDESKVSIKNLGLEIDKVAEEKIKKLDDEFKNLSDTISKDLQKQLESIEDSYDNQINAKKEQLKLLDQEINKEERLAKLREIEDEMSKVKADARFEFITASGEKIYTYDTARYSELEKQRDELIQQYKNEDLRNALRDEIDDLEEAKKIAIDNMRNKIDTIKDIQSEGVDNLSTNIANLKSLYDQDISNLQSYISQAQALAAQRASITFGGGTSSSSSSGYGTGYNSGTSLSAIERANEARQILASAGISVHHKGLDSGFAGNIPFDPKTETIAKLLKGEEIVFTQPQFNNIIPNVLKNFTNLMPKSSTGDSKTFHINVEKIVTDSPMDFFKQINHLTIAHTGG